MSKICKKCNELKPLDDFSIALSNKDNHTNICKPCVVIRNREYWRTPVGRISQIYASQLVCSRQRKHPPPTYSRTDLFTWAIAHGLETLCTAWKDSDFSKNLIPSIDRKDPNYGYSLSNIRLVTWAENNDKAYEDRKSCRHVTKQNRKIRQISLAGVPIREFDSISSAARELGITRVNINDVCRGKPQCKTAGGFIWQYT